MHGAPHLVGDVMTLQPWNISALPVLEEDNRVVGVVSEADLLPKEEFRDGDPDDLLPLNGTTSPASSGPWTGCR
ncbi:CBS domain-containing protein [Streptomyces sp. NPDC050658]|uniref:CBS domain-containing protein n=1 Tax=Streptomyces sp. NPDC050658 TaxID=3365633 RepID=UPI00378F5B9F